MSTFTWSRGLVLMLIGCFGVSPLVLASSNTGTLTTGSDIVCLHVNPPPISNERLVGFSGDSSFSNTFGSYSPTGLTGGTTVIAVWDNLHLNSSCGTGNSSLFAVSGFSVDPGQDWVSSITCHGVENTGSGATSYSYGNGIAIWTWSQIFGLSGTTSVSCTIVHS